ncbi:uncharacterized protein BKCO1_37000191 [Diplodia corticola]|uniref:Uncharacterized protein n=1 Tax=Diplodia corticola TaxID=236234 RepID=A0A1J9RXE0_9PEZI|nr:uncharacterized protein BKCO1_37000191 [Diplodia corticola]OJD32500.1 hypothetical protein BKCO1_37000191 [Diplodia corticola]
MSFQSWPVSWPRLDYESLGDPLGAAIRSTVGDAWNFETNHFDLWKSSYHIVMEIHNDPEQFRMEIDNLKLMHTSIFPQQSGIRGRLNKLRFNSLFKPIEKFCAGIIPSSEEAESGDAAVIVSYHLDTATGDAIRLQIYRIVHAMFGDPKNLNALFDLTIYADEFVHRRAVLTVLVYVRFYAYRRRIGLQESRRQKLGSIPEIIYWQILLLGFSVKSEGASRPLPKQMVLVHQCVAFAAQMEQLARQVDFARMVEEGVEEDVREAGAIVIQAGMAFGILDERGRLVDSVDEGLRSLGLMPS